MVYLQHNVASKTQLGKVSQLLIPLALLRLYLGTRNGISIWVPETVPLYGYQKQMVNVSHSKTYLYCPVSLFAFVYSSV